MSVSRCAWVVLVIATASTVLAGDPPAKVDGPPASGKSTSKTVPGKPAPGKPTSKSVSASKSNAARPASLSAEREAAAIAFAREHHPELAALIDKLHHDNRRDYDRAIREVSAACERLTRLKKQSADQYELSLAAWKLDSRAQLLAARMTVSPTPGLEAELKQVLAERTDVRLKEYKSEYARLQDRLGKLKVSIQAIESDKNAVVDKDLQRIKRSVARSRRPAPKSANKSSLASKSGVTEPPRPPAVPTTASAKAPADEKQH
jgi:hypothetical protein